VCDPPSRTWRSAWEPRRVALSATALALAVAGALTGGPPGWALVAVAGALVVSAVVLPTVREVEFGFPVGLKVTTATRSRQEALREAFEGQKGDLGLCARLLCDDPDVSADLLEAAWSRAAVVWRGPVDPYLRILVVCLLVELTLAHDRWAPSPAAGGPLSALDPTQRVAVVLHDFAGLSLAEIAAICGSTPEDTATALRAGVTAVQASRGAQR
jgi:Sigma-70, region 4